VRLVTDLFTQWYNVKQKQRQDPDGLDDADLDQIKTARDCLQLLFANRLEYGTIENFLSTAASVKDQKVVKQLTTWTTKLHQEFIQPSETSIYFESSTPENLIEMYHPFTKDVTNASFQGKPLTCSPWPLVKIVR
jgi:ABC-type nitrate/sulfonate/bicarbonate transport system substrate-binding protein